MASALKKFGDKVINDSKQLPSYSKKLRLEAESYHPGLARTTQSTSAELTWERR